MTVSKSTMESRTTAPSSTTTPGESTLCSTCPLMTQPCEIRLLTICARLFGLLFKREDAPFGIRFQYAKAIPFLQRHDHCAQSYTGAALLMEGDHRAIVHAIDVVTGKDEHIVAARFHDEVQILVNCVGGALVPIRLLAPDIGLEQANAALLPVQVPGLTDADMIVQRVGTILGQYGDINDAGIDAVAQGKINTAVLTA